MKDYYIEILKILRKSDGSKTTEELAHEIADEMRDIVASEVDELLIELRKRMTTWLRN